MDRRIIALLGIIAVLAVGLCYGLYTHQEVPEKAVNSTAAVNNTTVKNATLEQTEETSEDSSSGGQYGYCAICGKALSYSEAHSEYTQGKVCHDCASNPYYQTEEGAQYANEKLYEAYPDEYSWMNEDDSGDDSDDEDYYEYDDEDY